MYYSTRKLLSLRISFLVYALITLSPTDPTFKKLNIRENEYVKYLDELVLHSGDFSFKPLLTKGAIRTVVNDLCNIFHGAEEKSFLLETQTQNKKLLLQYLKKFRHIYSGGFMSDSNIINSLSTKKELNSVAMGYLMLVRGI